MKSREDVNEKLNELYHRRLSEYKKERLSVCHLNCIHNKRYRVKGKGKIGFCHSKDVVGKNGSSIYHICDDTESAKGCDYFECKNTCESVSEDFEKIIENPARCGQVFPKIGVLLWCLHDGKEYENYERKGFWSSLRTFFRRLWKK
jgi:hypothetical protein